MGESGYSHCEEDHGPGERSVDGGGERHLTAGLREVAHIEAHGGEVVVNLRPHTGTREGGQKAHDRALNQKQATNDLWLHSHRC